MMLKPTVDSSCIVLMFTTVSAPARAAEMGTLSMATISRYSVSDRLVEKFRHPLSWITLRLMDPTTCLFFMSALIFTTASYRTTSYIGTTMFVILARLS